MEEDVGEPEGFFPWEDVDASRQNKALQRRHVKKRARADYAAQTPACARCATPSDRLTWIYFESPEWTWKHLCGRAGWMVVCDRCRRQVGFFCEVLS